MRTLLVLIVAVLVAGTAEARGHVPISIVFVIDRSGSMAGPKLESTKEGMRDASLLLDPTDHIAVVVFDSAPTVLVPLEPAKPSPDRDKKIAAIKAGGGTEFRVALEAAWKLLDGEVGRRKHVVFLTDGQAPPRGIEELARIMANAKVTVSTIVLPGGDKALMERVANRTAGRFHEITGADRPDRPAAVLAAETQAAIDDPVAR